MTDKNYILTAEKIHKSYRIGSNEFQVLKGADLKLQHGEFLAVKGSSGSGKSTLLHILGGLDKPDKGNVKFEGRNIFNAGSINKYRNQEIGFVFQFYHLLNELNVRENVYLPAMVSKSVLGWLGAKKAAKQRACELLEKVALKHRINHKPYQLSGGERQRTAIARALMNKPKILLADEPTGNLDSRTGNGILELLLNLNGSGQSIIMVTHDMNIAARASRIISLEDGKIKND